MGAELDGAEPQIEEGSEVLSPREREERSLGKSGRVGAGDASLSPVEGEASSRCSIAR